MAEIKFACPHCNQTISCDDAWGGQQLQCPLCQGAFIAPGEPAAPAPPPPSSLGKQLVAAPPAGSGPRLSLGQVPGPASTGNRNIPIRNLAPPPPKKKNVWVTIAKVAAVLIVLGVAGYFGYGWLSDFQRKTNEKRREVEKNSDGGQVGHIGKLYEVLDATEPGRMGMPRGRASGPRQADTGVGREVPPDTEAAGSDQGPPGAPAVWTLDLAAAKIPEGRVNGTVSGTAFAPNATRVDKVGTDQVLRFVEGPLTSPERAILVYLHLKPGEKLSGQTLSVAKDARSPQVTQVMKGWKTAPLLGKPQFKPFTTGYAMKLELGQISEGAISGKIFLALPDPEQTVVAGMFKAKTSLTEGPAATAQPAAAPVAAPIPRAATVSAPERYGVAP